MITALVFLDLNGVDVQRERLELFDLTIAVAEGRTVPPPFWSQRRFIQPSRFL
jgi:hypothetical protein